VHHSCASGRPISGAVGSEDTKVSRGPGPHVYNACSRVRRFAMGSSQVVLSARAERNDVCCSSCLFPNVRACLPEMQKQASKKKSFLFRRHGACKATRPFHKLVLGCHPTIGRRACRPAGISPAVMTPSESSGARTCPLDERRHSGIPLLAALDKVGLVACDLALQSSSLSIHCCG
jgi:hypothetical protein